MKKLLLTTVIAVTTLFTAKAQIVNIPDANFKTYLVGNAAINTNADTEIQVSEATSFTGTINCGAIGITDLTGIEAFTSITELYCDANQLTNLDVSQNISLEILFCGSNQLTNLDVSQNAALGFLNCNGNLLTSLDISQNLAMAQLQCHSNQLTSLNIGQNTVLSILRCNHNELSNLDLSQNTSLYSLWCQNNQLTSLNVANGNNTNFTTLRAEVNPNLTCIEVDDVAYSTSVWAGTNYNFDATSSFNEDCSGTAGINDLEQIVLTIYPNPANTILNIEVNENTKIKIVNPLGETVAAQQLHTGNNNVDLSGFSNGIYFLNPENGTSIKFIKQ